MFNVETNCTVLPIISNRSKITFCGFIFSFQKSLTEYVYCTVYVYLHCTVIYSYVVLLRNNCFPATDVWRNKDWLMTSLNTDFLTFNRLQASGSYFIQEGKLLHLTLLLYAFSFLAEFLKEGIKAKNKL